MHRYYRADISLTVYPCSVLHPAYKLSYFRKLHWPEAWIKVARELVQTAYRDNYEGKFTREDHEEGADGPSRSRSRAATSRRNSVEDDDNNDEDEESDDEESDDEESDEKESHEESHEESDEDEEDDEDAQGEDEGQVRGDLLFIFLSRSLLIFVCPLQLDDRNIFEVLELEQITINDEAFDELARYLSTDPEPTADPLLWWTARRAMYPCLSRMALDFLSIPGTSSSLFDLGSYALIHWCDSNLC